LSHEKDWDKYLDYDEEYEDSTFEATEYLARRRRDTKPKRDSRKLIPGLVVRALGHHYDVKTDPKDDPDAAGPTRLCEIRRRLMKGKITDTLVAVGDRVWIVPNGDDAGKIERIEERERVLSRQRVGKDMLAEDVILANLDQVLVVFAAAQPEPHMRMLDRFLVIAEFNEVPAIICANKIDLIGLEATQALFSSYEEIGYDVVYTSTESGDGIEQLKAMLTDKVTAFTGPSGVGKSSVINALHPALQLEVGGLRNYLNKGRHTTRTSTLMTMPFGEKTYIADTPGIRDLGFYDIDLADLGFYFKEMEPLIHECHFPNCTHDHEPDCAVRAAADAGDITPERYDSYLRILHGERLGDLKPTEEPL